MFLAWPGRGCFRKGLRGLLTLLIELTWPKANASSRCISTSHSSRRWHLRRRGRGAAFLPCRKCPRRDWGATRAATLAAVLPSPMHLGANAPRLGLRHEATGDLNILDQMRRLGGGPNYLEALEKPTAPPTTTSGARKH